MSMAEHTVVLKFENEEYKALKRVAKKADHELSNYLEEICLKSVPSTLHYQRAISAAHAVSQGFVPRSVTEAMTAAVINEVWGNT